MEQAKPIAYCVFCSKPGKQENPGGIFVRGQYICPECELILVKSQVTEREYDNYIKIVKKIWSNY